MIPFEIPSSMTAKITEGLIYRIGGTLRDRATGRIVAHLQESGLQNLVSNNINPLASLIGAGNLASSVAANIQLEQVKLMLGGLFALNAATLAASVAGIGVSLVGFTLVQMRLSCIATSVDRMKEELGDMRGILVGLERKNIAEEQARLDSLLFQAEEAWVRKDPSRAWENLLSPLDEVYRYYRNLAGSKEVGFAIANRRVPIPEALQLYSTATSLAGLRIQILMLLNEFDAADFFSKEFSTWHEQLCDVPTRDVVNARWQEFSEQSNNDELSSRVKAADQLKPVVQTIQEVQQQSLDRSSLLRHLKKSSVTGREFIESLRASDGSSPVVLIPTN